MHEAREYHAQMVGNSFAHAVRTGEFVCQAEHERQEQSPDVIGVVCALSIREDVRAVERVQQRLQLRASGGWLGISFNAGVRKLGADQLAQLDPFVSF